MISIFSSSECNLPCLMTSDKNYLGEGNIDKFDALFFKIRHFAPNYQGIFHFVISLSNISTWLQILKRKSNSTMFYSIWKTSLGWHLSKGQRNSSWFFQADVSSKKRMSEFYFITKTPQVDLFLFVFWRKLKISKRHFEINWPLVPTYVYLF